MVGHYGPDNRPEKLPAEVPLPELKERGEIMFSSATGAAVGSGRGVTRAWRKPSKVSEVASLVCSSSIVLLRVRALVGRNAACSAMRRESGLGSFGHEELGPSTATV